MPRLEQPRAPPEQAPTPIREAAVATPQGQIKLIEGASRSLAARPLRASAAPCRDDRIQAESNGTATERRVTHRPAAGWSVQQRYRRLCDVARGSASALSAQTDRRVSWYTVTGPRESSLFLGKRASAAAPRFRVEDRCK